MQSRKPSSRGRPDGHFERPHSPVSGKCGRSIAAAHERRMGDRAIESPDAMQTAVRVRDESREDEARSSLSRGEAVR